VKIQRLLSKSRKCFSPVESELESDIKRESKNEKIEGKMEAKWKQGRNKTKKAEGRG